MPTMYLKLCLMALFFGGTFVSGRILASQVGPFTAAFLRFAIASLFLGAIWTRTRGRLPALSPGLVLQVALLGLTGVLAYNVLFFLGLQTVPASRASLIVATNPVLIALASALLFNERLGPLRLAGMALAVFGAATAITRGNPATLLAGAIGPGELYLIGCVLSWAVYALVGKVVMNRLTPRIAVTLSCLVGAILLLPLALAEGLGANLATLTPQVWLNAAYLGIFGTGLGFTWFYQGIERVGPSRASVFINFVPLFGVLLGGLILHEPLDPSLFLATGLVLGGVFLVNKK